MVSKLGWVIAAIIFLITFYLSLSFIADRLRGYGVLATTSAMRSLVQNVWPSIFYSEGIPADWESKGMAVLPGVKTSLYKIPLVVNETSGTARIPATLNITLILPELCEQNKTWQSTFRVYENDTELESTLYNQTYCKEGFVNFTEIFFKANLSAYQTKTLFIYFSGEKDVAAPPYAVAYQPTENISYKIFPQESVGMISLSKLRALTNFTYQEVEQMLGVPAGIKFEIEVSGTDTLLANTTYPTDTTQGYPGRPKGEIFVYSVPILMQDSNGEIKIAIPTLRLWQP